MAYIIDKKGKRVGASTYKHILPFSEGLAPFQDEHTGLWGMLDLNSSVAIAATYQECKSFNEGLAAVKLTDKWGYINSKNEVIIPLVFDGARHFYEGFASVQKIIEGESKWGIIDKNGTPITGFIYKFIVWFSEGIAGVCPTDRFTCVDATGRELFEPVFKFLMPFQNGYASALEPGNKHCLIDKLGNKVLTGFDDLKSYRESLVGARQNGLWVFLDITGKTIIPFIYQEIVGEFENDFCCVKLEDRYGIINKLGQTVVPFVLKEVVIPHKLSKELFQNNLVVANLDTRKGFISRDNKVVQGYTPPPLRAKYDVRKVLNPFGIIRAEDGEVVVPFQYSDIRPFKNGVAMVSLGTKTGYVDENGKWVIPLGNYGIASSFSEERAIADMEFSARETKHML